MYNQPPKSAVVVVVVVLLVVVNHVCEVDVVEVLTVAVVVVTVIAHSRNCTSANPTLLACPLLAVTRRRQ